MQTTIAESIIGRFHVMARGINYEVHRVDIVAEVSDAAPFRYLVGWDTYKTTGHTDTRERAVELARADLIRMRESFARRGDRVSDIEWRT